MKSYNDAKIWWISRVPETSTAAKTALEETYEQWQPLSDGSGEYVVCTMDLPQGKERWVIVRTHAQVQATQEQMEKKGKKTQQEWEKRLWHLSKSSLCLRKRCATGMETGDERETVMAHCDVYHERTGTVSATRPPQKETTPDQTAWYLVPTLEVDQQEVTVLARKKAAFIVATNILDDQRLSHEQVIWT